jgi:hypothetical protein
MEVEGAVERQEESPSTVSRIRDVSGAREASPRELRNECLVLLVHTHQSSLSPFLTAPFPSHSRNPPSRTYRFLRKECFPEVESYAARKSERDQADLGRM